MASCSEPSVRTAKGGPLWFPEDYEGQESEIIHAIEGPWNGLGYQHAYICAVVPTYVNEFVSYNNIIISYVLTM